MGSKLAIFSIKSNDVFAVWLFFPAETACKTTYRQLKFPIDKVGWRLSEHYSARYFYSKYILSAEEKKSRKERDGQCHDDSSSKLLYLSAKSAKVTSMFSPLWREFVLFLFLFSTSHQLCFGSKIKYNGFCANLGLLKDLWHKFAGQYLRISLTVYINDLFNEIQFLFKQLNSSFS